MSAEPPRFSVVIPSYNRPAPLRRCLAALAALDYPREYFEVIVVDDGGTTPLKAVVDPFRRRLDLHLLRRTNAGPGAARNTGAARARGEYLAFTDDDCRPEPGWLRAYAAAVADHPRDLLGGDTVNGLRDNLWSEGSQAVQTWLYDYFDRVDAPWRFFASNNLCVSTRAFLGLGGFDTETIVFASEDRELSERWRHAGGLLRHVPAARITHEHHLSAAGFLRQHFAYGRGGFRLRLARERKGLPSPPRDRRWILRYLTRYPFAEPGWRRKLALACTAWASFAALSAGYYYERMTGLRRRR